MPGITEVVKFAKELMPLPSITDNPREFWLLTLIFGGVGVGAAGLLLIGTGAGMGTAIVGGGMAAAGCVSSILEIKNEIKRQ